MQKLSFDSDSCLASSQSVISSKFFDRSSYNAYINILLWNILAFVEVRPRWREQLT